MPLPTDQKKINSDLFVLTYGAMISQLLIDCDNVDQVNSQLDKMGHNIGLRLIDDYLAKSSTGKCKDLKDVSEKLQQAFQMYLNVVPSVDNWSPNGDEFSLILYQNPLTEHIELPDSLQNLSCSAIYPGVIRGVLEMVAIPARVWIQRDQLKGDSETEIRVQVVDHCPTITDPAGMSRS